MAEVYIDIYDDRIELVSPGGMVDGTQIQDRDIADVPSMRRNPVIADVFTQLDYMEKRGSGLRKMRELTEKLPNFLKEKEPSYKTTTSTFYTTFYNLNWDKNGRIPIDEVAARVNSSEKNLGVNEESTLKKFGETEKSSEKRFGETEKSSEKNKKKNIGRTSQRVIDLVISDPSISAETMASKIGISSRAVEKHIDKLRSLGILIREGADRGGYWRIIVKPK